MASFADAPSSWARLRRLPRAELLLLAQAPFLLPLAAVALRRWGLRRVQEALARRTTFRRRDLDPAAALDAARRLGWLVEVAATRGPWTPNCLQRSLVLWWFLRRRGVDGDLRIGVRRRPGTDALDFHAWVEHHGEVLNDRRAVQREYASFNRPIAPRNASFD